MLRGVDAKIVAVEQIEQIGGDTEAAGEVDRLGAVIRGVADEQQLGVAA